MVNVRYNPKFVDTYAKNDDIKEFQDVFESNARIMYHEFRKVVTIPLGEQDWFAFLIYDLELLDVFKVYNVSRDNVNAIKALINYNFNPTLNNLYIFLDTILPEETTYLVENDVNGVVTIDLFDLQSIQGNITISDTTDKILIDVTTDTLLYINPANISIYDQTLYLLINYVVSGVKLEVQVITTFSAMITKYQKKMTKESFKIKVEAINKIINRKGV